MAATERAAIAPSSEPITGAVMIPNPLTTPTLGVPQVALLLGVGEDAVYSAIKAGTFPVPALRIGRKIRVGTKPLLDAIGLG